MNRIFGILVLCLAGCAPAILLAQAPPDLGKGLTPFTVYNSTAIDNINMTNGNVYVHIPLLSYPQRGKDLNLSFSIGANARVWGCGFVWPGWPGAGNGSTVCTWGMTNSWDTPAIDLYGPGIGVTGASIGSDQHGVVWPTLGYIPNCDSHDVCVTPFTFLNCAYYSADGGVHYFMSGVGSCGGGAGYTFGAYPAVDGSGYNPASSPSRGTVVDRNGVSVGGGFQYDADGNQLTLSDLSGNPTSYTDTLNRTIPDPEVGSVPTSTTNCPASSLASSAKLWTVPGPSTANSGQEKYYLCYQAIMPSPEFPGHPYILPKVAPPVLVAIVLPDRTFYQFRYNNFLELNQITLPTGGIVKYVFSDINISTDDAWQARLLTSRTTIDGVGPPATTNYTLYPSPPLPGDPGNVVYIQTDPLGNDEVHFIQVQPAVTSADDVQTNYYQGCSPYKGTSCMGSGQLLKSVARAYQRLLPQTATMLVAAGGSPTTQSRIMSEITTLYSSTGTTLVSRKVYQYVPPQVSFQWYTPGSGATQNCLNCGEFNQIRSVEEDDYGNGTYGPQLKLTTTHYKWEDPTVSGNSTAGAPYLAAGLVDLPWYINVIGAVGSGPGEETDYYYDETAPVPSNMNTQTAGYPSPVRGHLTSVSRSRSGAGTQGGPKNPQDSTTITTWYDTGVPYQTFDPNGNAPTTYSYDPLLAGAYVTKTVDPIGNSVSAKYDYNTGLMTSFTGVNSATTTYTYDALRRPLNVLYPDGAQHNIMYNVNLPPGQGNVFVQDSIDISRFDEHTIVYDGFGREIETQHNTDQASTTYVDTTYDQNGHVWKVTNPYRSKLNPTSEPTYGFTTTLYDALGREISSVLSDRTSTTSTSYSGMPYTWLSSTGNKTYYGLSKTYTDPDGNKTVWASTAVGLLGATVENSNGAQSLPALTTIYLYDGLNNLRYVEQQGDGTNSNAFRNRTFLYDGLSRLTYSLNPEAGAINYLYDLNSNLITKTDARNTVTTYKYDALNRLTSKTYNTSDLAHTPYSCYQYGTVAGYSLEKLAIEWTELPSSTPCVASSNALTSRAFSTYDSRGRIFNEQQCVTGGSCSMNVSGANTYSYDLAGHLLNFGNLIGTGQFTNNYDSGGQLSSIMESWSGQNVPPLFPSTLFSAATYAPHGALTNAIYGTNLTLTRTYDSRLRILGEIDSGTTVQQPAHGSSGSLAITGGEQSK